MTNDRRNNDKALISVLKKKEEQSRQTKPSFGFADRIMQQVKISAHRKQIRNKRRTLAGIITMAVAASILLLVMLNHNWQNKETSTNPNISIKAENKYFPKTENTENQTNTSPQKPQRALQLTKRQSSKSGGQQPFSNTTSCQSKPCPVPNKQSDNLKVLTEIVSNPSTATGNREALKEPRQDAADSTNYNADFSSPQNLAVVREPEVCIECDFQEMDTEMTAMINELETPSEP